MASTSTRILCLPHFIALSLLFALTLTLATSDNSFYFARTIDRKLTGLKKEKLSQFKFYWHDILTAKNPTSFRVVKPAFKNSVTEFGFIQVFDNPLTLEPDISSKLVGRAQGLYTTADMEQIALLMVENFHFIEGKYNGSTITVSGRNQVNNKVREMPIIGGSGVFRFARGYVEARTYELNWTTLNAVVEYNVYVLHY